LAERAVSVNKLPETPDGAILEKLTNTAKSGLVEHFSVQPLNRAVPKDFIN